MKKRMATILAIAMLAISVCAFVGTPEAAATECYPSDVPIVANDGSFADFFGTGPVSALSLLDFQNGSVEDAIADALDVLRDRDGDDPEILQFYSDALVWFAAINPCEKAIAYPGPFTNHPPAPTGAYGWGKPNVTAAAVPASSAATGGGNATAPLAHTGADTAIPGILGATLLGAGMLIEGGRRKRNSQ